MVVHDGGTPWWVPLIVGLSVALAAACASYAAAWWFKKRDVDRENAFRAAERVDEAEQITARRERYDAEGGAAAVLRLVQEARVLPSRSDRRIWTTASWPRVRRRQQEVRDEHCALE
jgi:hypothetical protein